MLSGEEHIGPVIVMRLDQPIDREHAPQIEEWAEERLQAGERFLVLHCGKVPCFDSVGLETVLSLTRSAASRGSRIALTNLNTDCATTLRVTRLERAIEHYLTVEDAVRAMRGGLS